MAFKIQTPSVGRILAEALGLKGRIDPELEKFIIPTIQLANAELSGFVCTSRSCTSTGSGAAVAAEFPTLQFIVPPGVLALITRLDANTNGAGETSLRASFAQNALALGTAGLNAFTDQRLIQQNQTPSCNLTSGSQAAAISPIEWNGRLSIGAATAPTYEGRPVAWVIGSGVADATRSLGFQSSGLNEVLRLTLEWVEFQLTV